MALSSDEGDWETAIPELLPMAMRLAIRLCGNHAVAEDAVQNAMLKLVQRIDDFEGQSKLSTYFARIVIHQCRDLMNRQQRRQTQELCESHELTATTNDDPGLGIEQEERNERLRRAVQQLPARQREVIVLSVWEQRSNADIAELLNINLQNVYANLTAARKSLKQRLKFEFERPQT